MPHHGLGIVFGAFHIVLPIIGLCLLYRISKSLKSIAEHLEKRQETDKQ